MSRVAIVRTDEIPGVSYRSMPPQVSDGQHEPVFRQMLDDQRGRADPETERKEIRGMLRLMRDNFERRLYEGEDYQYWQKVNALKEKLSLLERAPDPAINRAAQTLLDLR
jgi:hypothetical protein